MLSNNAADIDQIIETGLGRNKIQVLKPIEGKTATGEYLKYHAVYTSICDARREDDPTLPQGVWVHELKQADWPAVSNLALDALENKSKDLQIALWLLEAEVQMKGFVGIPPTVNLIIELCKKYWTDIHPQMVDGDIEYRINPFYWASSKLIPVLRLIPITESLEGEPSYTLSDWITAQQNDRLRGDSSNKEIIDGISCEKFSQALSLNRKEDLYRSLLMVGNAIESFQSLAELLNIYFGDEAPSFLDLIDVLNDIKGIAEVELKKRGLSVDRIADLANMENVQSDTLSSEYTDSEQGLATEPTIAANSAATTAAADEFDQSFLDKGYDQNTELSRTSQSSKQVSRLEAYRQLEKAAEFLMTIEPHSPAPYLVLQACRWGSMDATALYQEVFVQCQGQLNIFDLLGVPPAATEGTDLDA